MSKQYDLIIVGAGPAGLMAAKVAAENGLSVALLERKTKITEVNRSCATMFAIEDDYFFGERMYFSAKQGRLVFPINGFSVKYDGPYKNFYGQMLYVPDGKTHIKIGDYDQNIKKGDQGRLSVVYDKKCLLTGMLEEARAGGVEIFGGINVTGVAKAQETVTVKTSSGACFEGSFVIAADGLNSRLAQVLGLNRDRILFGTVKTLTYEASGVTQPSPYAYKMTTMFEKKHGIPITCGIVPKASGEDSFWLFIGGPADDRIDYVEALEHFTNDSPFAPWFRNVRLGDRQTAVLNFWSPIEDPFKDNVLVVSDAAWSIEAECTGAMMCGWKAAQAVSVALKDNKPDKEGIRTYLSWWQETFLKYDYKGYLQSLAMFYVLTEDDADYLFSLLKKPFPCTLNPHKLQNLMNAAIMEHLPVIQAQKPEIIEKFQRLASTPLEELLKPLKKINFPDSVIY